MENRRADPAWTEEPIEALQRAAYAMVAATESFKQQFQPRTRPRPITYHASSESTTQLRPQEYTSGDFDNHDIRDVDMDVDMDAGADQMAIPHRDNLDTDPDAGPAGFWHSYGSRPTSSHSGQVGPLSLRPILPLSPLPHASTFPMVHPVGDDNSADEVESREMDKVDVPPIPPRTLRPPPATDAPRETTPTTAASPAVHHRQLVYDDSTPSLAATLVATPSPYPPPSLPPPPLPAAAVIGNEMPWAPRQPYRSAAWRKDLAAEEEEAAGGKRGRPNTIRHSSQEHFKQHPAFPHMAYSDADNPLISQGQHHYNDKSLPPQPPSSSSSFTASPAPDGIPGNPKLTATATTTTANGARPANLSRVQEVLFVLLICLAQMLMLAGLAIALVPAQGISRSFFGPGTRIATVKATEAWYSAAYGLTSATFVLPSGRLGDLWGHKRVFVVGFVWFGIWSAVAGAAEAVARGYGPVDSGGGNGVGGVFFCFCRGMQGIGPALLVPNGQAMLGRAYAPGMRKNMVLCLFGASAPVGFVSGSIIASLLTVNGSWPWAFWTMALVCAALAITSVFSPHEKGETLWSRLDAPGTLLGVSGLVLFNFAFNQAPVVSWNTPYIYFLLIIGAMLIAAFVRHECRDSTRHPLVPIAAMKSPTNFVLGCTAAGWGCFGIWIYFTFCFLEVSRGWSPLLASVSFAHAPVTGLIASILAGYLITRVKPHWIMLMSMCAFFFGSLLLATAPVEQIYWLNTFFSILIMPFGMDMSNPAVIRSPYDVLTVLLQGIAASLVVTTVNYSISLALGIAGTIETQTNKQGQDILRGFRSSQYFGTGLGFLGVVIALGFLLQSRHQSSSERGPRPGGRRGYTRTGD
ncbi:major facilitator superfamily-domain-containing protein [Cercophora scortea]|uniref:Major facilitator superfamily-domain-containing protein n=1 Tax=Cercophora scortea TaxID=314031 RepID=A0AAE0M685_9PEZI|nr:major facilitator superfamily-domain-containing protein [Cercophora scortea]